MMARFILLLLFFLSGGSLFAQQSVEATLARQSLVTDVVLLPNDKLVAVGERGHVLLSADLGETWQQVLTPTRAMLTGAFFSNAQNGWAVGHDAVILRTRDGGKSWTRVYEDVELQSPLMDIWFEDERHGVAIGAYGLALRTTNGGESWQTFYLSDEEDFHLNQIWAEGKEMLVAAESGRIYLSNDSGLNWEAIDSPYEGSLFTISRRGDLAVAAGLRGHIVWSRSPFTDWTEVPSPVSSMLLEIVVESDSRFLVLGQGQKAVRLDLSDTSNPIVQTVATGVKGSQLRYLPVGKGAVSAGSFGIRRIPLLP